MTRWWREAVPVTGALASAAGVQVVTAGAAAAAAGGDDAGDD